MEDNKFFYNVFGYLPPDLLKTPWLKFLVHWLAKLDKLHLSTLGTKHNTHETHWEKKNNRGQTRAAEGKGDKNPGNRSQSLFKGLQKCNFVTDLNSIQNTCFQIWVDASTHPLCSQDATSSPCTAHQYTLSKIQLMGSLKCLC